MILVLPLGSMHVRSGSRSDTKASGGFRGCLWQAKTGRHKFLFGDMAASSHFLCGMLKGSCGSAGGSWDPSSCQLCCSQWAVGAVETGAHDSGVQLEQITLDLTSSCARLDTPPSRWWWRTAAHRQVRLTTLF